MTNKWSKKKRSPRAKQGTFNVARLLRTTVFLENRLDYVETENEQLKRNNKWFHEENKRLNTELQKAKHDLRAAEEHRKMLCQPTLTIRHMQHVLERLFVLKAAVDSPELMPGVIRQLVYARAAAQLDLRHQARPHIAPQELPEEKEWFGFFLKHGYPRPW